MTNGALAAAILAANKHPASSAEMLGQFKKAAAYTKQSAVLPDMSASGAEKVLKKLVEDRYLRPAEGGRYYLDKDRIAHNQAVARKVGLVLLAFLLSAGASLIALLSRAG